MSRRSGLEEACESAPQVQGDRSALAEVVIQTTKLTLELVCNYTTTDNDIYIYIYILYYVGGVDLYRTSQRSEHKATYNWGAPHCTLQ